MKICFVSPFAYGLLNPTSRIMHGGAEIDLFFIAQELIHHEDYEVSFVTGNFGQPDKEKINQITVYKSFQVSHTGWRKLVYGLVLAGPKLWAAMNRANADIYIQEGAGIETALVALFCKVRGRRFIYRVASTVECTGEFVKMFPLVGRFFLYGLRQADAVVTEDQEEVDLLHKYYRLPAEAIYDTTPIPSASAVLEPDERHHILWVSRLIPMKRPEIFLDVAAHFPDQKFVMVAPSDTTQAQYAGTIGQRARQLKNLEFIPGLPHQELDHYYQHAQLFINTSDFEGYPNTFIEAGKYGVPILSLNVNPDGLFDHQQYGDWAKGDRSRLTELVKVWIKHSDLRQRAGINFSRYVREKNDMKKNIFSYIRLFQKISPTERLRKQ